MLRPTVSLVIFGPALAEVAGRIAEIAKNAVAAAAAAVRRIVIVGPLSGLAVAIGRAWPPRNAVSFAPSRIRKVFAFPPSP